MSASEAARAVEDAAHAGDTVQALYKTSIAASRAATVRPHACAGRALCCAARRCLQQPHQTCLSCVLGCMHISVGGKRLHS